jgi:dynein light chain 1, axonemal
MSQATTIKDALKKWEEKHGQKAIEATDIQLQFQFPPIQKMDNTLSTLVACE